MITYGYIHFCVAKTLEVSVRLQIEHPIEKEFTASVSQGNTLPGQFHPKEMSRIEQYIISLTGSICSAIPHEFEPRSQAEHQQRMTFGLDTKTHKHLDGLS